VEVADRPSNTHQQVIPGYDRNESPDLHESPLVTTIVFPTGDRQL
jgi:hypothetical protein